MEDKLFKELLESIKEGGRLLRKIKREKEKNSKKQPKSKKKIKPSR